MPRIFDVYDVESGYDPGKCLGAASISTTGLPVPHPTSMTRLLILSLVSTSLMMDLKLALWERASLYRFTSYSFMPYDHSFRIANGKMAASESHRTPAASTCEDIVKHHQHMCRRNDLWTFHNYQLATGRVGDGVATEVFMEHYFALAMRVNVQQRCSPILNNEAMLTETKVLRRPFATDSGAAGNQDTGPPCGLAAFKFFCFYPSLNWSTLIRQFGPSIAVIVARKTGSRTSFVPLN
uniref:Uncharacterized protein n=1 Tax=Coccidioides posadasii RMSCC 3488 TaxID=454284 RepID=A0A0J6F1L4_COCPO|nr:hypothetical protein CPAG_00330 [Coccidioides posadasii RMSCC 3488]